MFKTRFCQIGGFMPEPSEPMLSLHYDYDALSLGLLNYQVRSMIVPLKENRAGCLVPLNSSCQNKVIGRALLKNVTISIHKEGVVLKSWSTSLYSTHCFSLDFGSECLQRRKKKRCPFSYSTLRQKKTTKSFCKGWASKLAESDKRLLRPQM